MSARKILVLTASAAAVAALAGCDMIGGGSAESGSQGAATPAVQTSHGSATPGASGQASAASVQAAAAPDEPARLAATLDDNQAGGAGAPQAQAAADPTPTKGEREVQFPVVAQGVADGMKRAGLDASKLSDASVPVLAPGGISTEQASQYTNSYRATPDGYFARWTHDDYDVVLSGTKMYGKAPDEAKAPPARDTTQVQVSETETGLSATFNKFGADYSVELVCRGAGGEEGQKCATRDEAAALAQALVPVK